MPLTAAILALLVTLPPTTGPRCDAQVAIARAKAAGKAVVGHRDVEVQSVFGPVTWGTLAVVLPEYASEDFATIRLEASRANTFFHIRLRERAGPRASRDTAVKKGENGSMLIGILEHRSTFVAWISAEDCTVLSSWVPR